MDVTDFNHNFLNNLVKKIDQEQKKCFFWVILMLIERTIMNINQQMNF